MGWLLFFSALPSKPVGRRVKVWRRLTTAGAVALKGSVYILPAGAEREDFLGRLVAEIAAMGGEAAFARVDRVETVPDAQIVALFEKRLLSDYRPLEAALGGFEREIDAARRGVAGLSRKTLARELRKLQQRFDKSRRRDFFPAAAGEECRSRLARAAASVASLAGFPENPLPTAAIARRSVEAYRGKLWRTCSGPSADRAASAWLIRRFIDPAALFRFVQGTDAAAGPGDAPAFAVPGGEFTRGGGMSVFEVLVRSFGLADPALARIAGIVRDLEAGDARHRRAESPAAATILEGIRRTAGDDMDALERGMALFEMLYAAQRR